MAPYTKTCLIPGSTGDGWELSAKEIDALLAFVIEETRDLESRLLIGVLRPDADIARLDIEKTLGFLKELTGAADDEKALENSGVCGFTVCAPKGGDLSQDTIRTKLSSILDLGYPTALYQLPQITENEIAPETFEALAARYGNFYLFKDTSGRDTVSLSGVKTEGVFMLRGMEGAYQRWYKASPGGLYDGFLLGSANCFAREYHRMFQNIDEGKPEEAMLISEKTSGLIGKVMEKAGTIPFGNAFANANKALDHCFAYGPEALNAPTPMTHSGKRLPGELPQFAYNLLKDEGLLPERGYLE
jgi:dihydrodipicolinate synthase/N-acetylneuraminate lyase